MWAKILLRFLLLPLERAPGSGMAMEALIICILPSLPALEPSKRGPQKQTDSKQL